MDKLIFSVKNQTNIHVCVYELILCINACVDIFWGFKPSNTYFQSSCTFINCPTMCNLHLMQATNHRLVCLHNGFFRAGADQRN